MSIDWKKLAEPFPEQDIDWRIGRSGIKNGKPWAVVLAYVTARGVMDRLDEVVGPENWSSEFEQVQGGMLCRISIKATEHGAWVEKMDGSEPADVEGFKGAISGALKRAAVHFGVGRYLYQLGETFAEFTDDRSKGQYVRIKDRDGKEYEFYWVPPKLPAWALPGSRKSEPEASVPKQPEPKPKPKVTPKAAPTKPALDRDALTKQLMDLYRPFMNLNPDVKIADLLKSRYGVTETKLMTPEQLQDLVHHMQAGVLHGAPAVSGLPKAEESLPEDPLGLTKIKVKVAYVSEDRSIFEPLLGKTFQEVGREKLEKACTDQSSWFLREKRPISPAYQEFFSKAEEWLFPGMNKNKKPIEGSEATEPGEDDDRAL